MNNIKFMPYIGKNYKNQSPKILILGTSQYNVKDPVLHTQNLINDLIQEKQKGNSPNYLKTFTLFSNIFCGEKHSTQDTATFWEGVSFYNYIQRDLKEPRNKPNREDWQNAFPAFKECLEMVHPDVIYTWGKELGNQIKNISENSFSTVNFEGKEIEILHFGDKKIPFKILPHPTSNEFGDKLSPEIAAYKELVKKFLAQ